MATMYVTVAGAGDKSGSSWANAMGYAEFETDFEGSAAAGDIYYVMSGTYTLTSNLLSSLDGTAASMINVIGVSDESETEAQGTDRPFFDGGASYGVRVDNYWQWKNCRFEGEQTYVLRGDTGTKVINCKADNSSGTADRSAIDIEGLYSLVFNCEGISDAGYGIGMFSTQGQVYGCYAHDSKSGIHVSGRSSVSFNIVDTCTTYGVQVTGATIEFGYICNNTIYNCVTGINAIAGQAYIVLNNQIVTNTTKGIVWASAIEANLFDYNNYNGNTGGDTTNVTKGSGATANAPGFTDAGGGDFSGVDSDDAFAILLGVS